jgi:transposase
MEKKLPVDLAQITTSFEQQRPVKLMFQDEARFGRISDKCYCWAKFPLRPMVQAMITHQYTYAYAAVCPQDGAFDALVLPQVNGACMQIFLTEVAKRHPNENIIMVLDGAGWHKTKFKLPANLKLHFLPPYSPELNPQEIVWHELREKWFHNKVFDSLDALEDQLVAALKELEQQPDTLKSIAGWDWIINTISNAN